MDTPATPLHATDHTEPLRAPGTDPQLPAQVARVKVFHSIERPGLTPVFGSSVPPSGLSGRLRGVAFGYSENDLRHWLLLLLADRINVVEGLFSDLRHGHVPNVFAEMGARAEWRHNRAGFVRKALVLTLITGLVIHLLRRRRR